MSAKLVKKWLNYEFYHKSQQIYHNLAKCKWIFNILALTNFKMQYFQKDAFRHLKVNTFPNHQGLNIQNIYDFLMGNFVWLMHGWAPLCVTYTIHITHFIVIVWSTVTRWGSGWLGFTLRCQNLLHSFFYKNKLYKNFEPHFLPNLKNILIAQIVIYYEILWNVLITISWGLNDLNIY